MLNNKSFLSIILNFPKQVYILFIVRVMRVVEGWITPHHLLSSFIDINYDHDIDSNYDYEMVSDELVLIKVKTQLVQWRTQLSLTNLNV